MSCSTVPFFLYPFELPTFYGWRLNPRIIASNAKALQVYGFEFISYPLVPEQINEELSWIRDDRMTLFIGQLPYELRLDLIPWIVDSIFHTSYSSLTQYHKKKGKGCYALVQLSGAPRLEVNLSQLRVIADLAGIWIHYDWPVEESAPVRNLVIEPSRIYR